MPKGLVSRTEEKRVEIHVEWEKQEKENRTGRVKKEQRVSELMKKYRRPSSVCGDVPLIDEASQDLDPRNR